MDEIATKTAYDLYEADFYAWTQEQAALLRAGNLAAADIANILEEIETLGRTEVSELRSRLKVLLLHLLKEMYQPEKAGRSWLATIVNQRDEIELHLEKNPSLKSQTHEAFTRAYSSARKVAAAETGLPIGRFPVEPPFSLAQAMDERFWPGRSVADRGT